MKAHANLRLRALVVRMVIVLSSLVVAAHVAAIGGTDQRGRTYDLDEPTGAYTVVDFAAHWCEPCHRALPRLQTLADEFPTVRFVVVSVDERVEGRDRLVRDLDLRLPVIWDSDQAIVGRFSPREFPATYVLDPEGRVVYEHVGYTKKAWARFESALTSLARSREAEAERNGQ